MQDYSTNRAGTFSCVSLGFLDSAHDVLVRFTINAVPQYLSASASATLVEVATAERHIVSLVRRSGAKELWYCSMKRNSALLLIYSIAITIGIRVIIIIMIIAAAVVVAVVIVRVIVAVTMLGFVAAQMASLIVVRRNKCSRCCWCCC